MASLDSLKVRSLLASGVVEHRASDKPVAIRLTYIGTGSVTSVTVTTATNIVMVTSDGGTDTYAFSSYATVGALVDAINADGIFSAKVLETLRSYATASQFVDGAITAVRDTFNQITYPVYVDTSAALYQSVALSPMPYYGMPKGHRVHLQEVFYNINVGTAAADSFQIWMRKTDNTETQIYSALSVDNTDTTITWASGEAKITGEENADLIVVVKDAASLADGGVIRASGIRE